MEERFKQIIAEQLGIDDLERITEDATLASLGADSLDQVESIMTLEENYDITIPDEEVEKFKNLGDVWRYVESHYKP